MQNLKFKFPVFSLIVVFFLGLAVQSCDQEELTEPAQDAIALQDRSNVESTTIELKEDNPILKGLKASEDVQNYNIDAGKLIWEMATMVTYNSEETLPLVLVPIDNGQEGTLSMFVAAYNEKKGSFHSFLNTFDAPSDKLIEEGYTGTIEFKTVENITGLKVVYSKGSLMEKHQSELSSANYRGVNVRCFLECIGNTALPSLITGMAVVCSNAGSCCFSLPTPYNPCCAAFAACSVIYGGIAGYCAWDCWE